jgi:hypothetical protein
LATGWIVGDGLIFLGLDKDANLVVIELKRTDDGGHMELQSIRYAAMVSQMTFDQAVEAYTTYLQGQRREEDARDVARLLWKIKKAYSLGIPKNELAHGVSQTEEEHAYGEKYTIFWPNGRSFWTGSVKRSFAGKGSRDDFNFGRSGVERGVSGLAV